MNSSRSRRQVAITTAPRRSIWFSGIVRSLIFCILFASCASPGAHAQNWTVYTNVKYGLFEQEVADLYLLNRGVNPLVIFIHGGGWQGGDKSVYAGYYARLYANAGFHVMSINYRLASYSDATTQWNAQLQDVQEAVRFIREAAPFLRIDPNRIGVVGESAGAHLGLFLGSLNDCATNLAGGVDRCLLFGSRSSRVNAVVDMFGPTDLTRPEMYNSIGPLALFGGRSFAQAPLLYQNASPIRYVKPGSAPTCIVHGLYDTTAPFSQSTFLTYQLAASRVPYQLITFRGGHSFSGLGPLEQNLVDLRALQCISGYLYPNPLNAR